MAVSPASMPTFHRPAAAAPTCSPTRRCPRTRGVMNRIAPRPALLNQPKTTAFQNPAPIVAGLITISSVPLKVGTLRVRLNRSGKSCIPAPRTPMPGAATSPTIAATRNTVAAASGPSGINGTRRRVGVSYGRSFLGFTALEARRASSGTDGLVRPGSVRVATHEPGGIVADGYVAGTPLIGAPGAL